MRRPARLLAAVAALILLATGCARGSGSDGGPAADPVTLQVFAAASLQEPFEVLGQQFEQEHEGVTVEFNLAGSSTLVEQIRQGAPADVFASADERTMATLTEAGLAGAEPVDFTTNTLMIAVPAGNPAGVTDLASLTEERLNLVVCAPEVPCGAATETVEKAAGLELSPVSEEQSVTDVLNKVTSGEADAGLVYVTDVRKAGDAVEGIAFPESSEAVNVYPITTVKDAANAELGQEFVDLVTGELGQVVLADYGFGGA
ncbi:molybdate ABC transporter substrate-binding protein [Brachybacterium sp. J153]|uniref:molybdate ABC transporter substrate-binding protein n=1 Tax=Brachybacterium sp. J153 TaxID=3116488 RepID=UPI002E77C080|nr:molybdate ABC transporter substrate-binding protein [Brachybacterium sp. J153]MEE1617206.1 molybdate ABC transporter substrate-binding protein [Brachybacterium sp. J153]